MLVGTLKVEVHIPGATSLKDKRQVVKGTIQKVQRRFNVSIAQPRWGGPLAAGYHWGGHGRRQP